MQVLNNQCKPCPEGSKWQAPGFCVSAFPPKACTGNDIRDPLDPQGCRPCLGGQKANSTHTECLTLLVPDNNRLAPKQPTTGLHAITPRGAAPNGMRAPSGR